MSNYSEILITNMIYWNFSDNINDNENCFQCIVRHKINFYIKESL